MKFLNKYFGLLLQIATVVLFIVGYIKHETGLTNLGLLLFYTTFAAAIMLVVIMVIFAATISQGKADEKTIDLSKKLTAGAKPRWIYLPMKVLLLVTLAYTGYLFTALFYALMCMVAFIVTYLLKHEISDYEFVQKAKAEL